VNIPLLYQVRSARGEFVPIADLGSNAEVVQRDLDDLDAFGFRFERHPYRGVAYRGPAERLCPDQIECALNTRLVGRRIAVWNRVTSTNDIAGRAASSRTNDGFVVLAEEQTAGRGRRGRSWFAQPRSSILMSVLLFPPELLDNPAWLTALGAVAAADVVEEWTGRPARIKWPNDVRVAGQKVAGVLVERGQGSIIGIGLNVNTDANEFPESLQSEGTSIYLLTGESADRSEMAKALINRIDEHYSICLIQGSVALKTPWCSRFELLGRVVRVHTKSATFVSRLVDADFEDGLTLNASGGPCRHIPMHEIIELTSAEEAPSPS